MSPALPTTKKTPRGRCCRYWYQPRLVRDYLLALTEGDERLFRALTHLVYSTLREDAHETLVGGLDVAVPMPFYVWQELEVRPEEVDRLGVLLPGWKKFTIGSRCREYSLEPYVVVEVLKIALEHMDGGDWVNVLDGQASKKRRFEKTPRDKAHGGRPRRTNRVTVNWQAAHDEVYRMLRTSEALTHAHHRARAIQAIRCLQAIRTSNTFRMSSTKFGFASYVPVYHQVDVGGRWYELLGGFQGCPQFIKAALLRGTGNWNYDLRQAHLAAAVSLCGELNAHCQWSGDGLLIVGGLDASPEDKAAGIFGARDLLKTKSAYDVIASAVDLPRATVKTCILSLLYGGSSAGHVWGDGEAGAVLQALINHHGGDKRAAFKSHTRLMPKLKHLIDFRRSLLRTVSYAISTPSWLRRCRRRLKAMVQVGYGGNVTNAVGTVIEVPARPDTTPAERGKAARRAMSHILTGIEQNAIEHLLRAIKERGVTVAHLEHDGVVVTSAIPQAAVDQMRERSLLSQYAQLDVKPYSDRCEVDPLDRLVETVHQRRSPQDSGSHNTRRESPTNIDRDGSNPQGLCYPVEQGVGVPHDQ